MLNFIFNLTRQVYRVGYNDGLAGEKVFYSLQEAITETNDSLTLMGNITIRDKKGNLIAQFD